jgi:hypothetical protein
MKFRMRVWKREGGMEVGAHTGAHFQLVSPDSEKKTETL